VGRWLVAIGTAIAGAPTEPAPEAGKTVAGAA
jgi:hypothetical protein